MTDEPKTPLELSAFCVRGEPITYDDAIRAEFVPFKVGDPWGPPWSTTWFRVRGRAPQVVEGRQVVACFDLGFDGPTGFTCEALAWKDGKPWRGVDPNHRWLPIDGPDVDFYLEAAANPRATEAGIEPAPSMLALRRSPEPAFVLRQAELVVRALPADGVSGAPLDPSHRITAVGHAHIDTAWEWPVREAKRKVARSWSTQLALMDGNADYVFAASQPAHYAWMKKSYPDIYRRVKEKVAAGQWEPVGAMWVEADCNLPSGESLVRQLLQGKRFFMQEFGYETKILWLPDVFGYPGNLPQLISEAGCAFFLTQKLSWNDTNKPEHHTFLWEGIDGTRIFTHFPPADTYNGTFTAGDVERSIRNFKDGQSSHRSLYLFGWGDGGGGPQPEMIESAHRLGVEIGRAGDFFEAASAEANGLAVSVGELYFELHRGTYTSQSRTKRLNRLAQQALREAEMWSVASGGAYPTKELGALWRTLLLNQFHDILPGSSIDWVYEEAERDLAHVMERAAGIGESAMSAIVGEGEQLVAFNSTSHPRTEVVSLNGEYTRIEAPPCGWSAVIPRSSEPEVAVTDFSMENELLRVEWDDRAVLTSIWDKEERREVLSGSGNLLQLHDDNPARWDAWDLDPDHRNSFTELTGVEEMQWRGGLRGLLSFGRRFGGSWLFQTMSLDAGSRVLRFETFVDWQERHKMLKVAFPVTVTDREATYEIQFGHIRRPTHEDTSQAKAMFEVCAQRWADLGDGGYGVALLNDCKHGYDIHGSVMRLSLLRGPTHPDPTADLGGHQFTYALMPHPGDFREAGVIEAAEDLNSPLLPAYGNFSAGSARSLIEVDTRQVVVEAIKRAEDSDATIVRLYEAWGRRCEARLRTTLPASRAFLCDLLERNREEVAVRGGMLELELSPFKILTVKLEP
ncbi:MAG TPA: glycoside hydrolase family 38 C-terminal domain-containing protein [Candidatus Dormibacteraeota bacterium]|nr:glycoside hydrolase family 38 C-terminal domain-containing protein [Candidatus Dormibacteraeota bacterium]